MNAASGTCTVTATESEGTNFLGSAANPQSITAVATIDSLMTQVNGLNLSKGNINSLLSKLDAAQRGKGSAARGQLGAFINEVQALQRSGRLDASAATSLIAQAEFIISGL